MRISDWSSDVCSSDLIGKAVLVEPAGHQDREGQGDNRSGKGGQCQGDGERVGEAGEGADRRADQRVAPRRVRPCRPVTRRGAAAERQRSEEHTSELQSLMRISYAVFCLKKKNKK